MVWLSPSPKGPFLETGPPSTSSWLHVYKKAAQLQQSTDLFNRVQYFLQQVKREQKGVGRDLGTVGGATVSDFESPGRIPQLYFEMNANIAE